ncbi:MAG TPA: CRTAC1 family protein [Blastocatellia bacterium]|nr:CRTAC1 family protein [Blastocatellia bacterium]HMZ21333.1 CRTAC1 family protein [Blastocatellia bacterium]HNG34543.1 CRTAC1 family protein [Blastocatellia bacterium]
MQSRVPRIVLIIFFIALLAFPLVYKRLSARNKAAESKAANPSIALSRYGFSLTEAAESSGIRFKHSAPKLDAKLSHIMEQVASMGAAVSVADFNRDGWQDVYVTNSGEGSKNALYQNTGKGAFQDVAEAMNVTGENSRESGVSMGAVWGDYDNDGFEDLFLYKWGKPELFHNDGGKGFTRAGEAAGLPRWVNANTAVWFDYDRDGKLDLFLGGYYAESVDLWNLPNTKMMPESFEYATNGGRKYLFHNLGGGKFEEVAEQLGIKSTRWALAAVAADLRGTGYPDLFIANDYAVSELFFNDGGKRFREVGAKTGVGYSPKSGMTASVGDVLNRGQFGIYVTNISEEGVLVQGNNLWMPKAGTSGENLQYQNLANAMGVELGGWSFGAQFGDLNNDGFLDIYLTNGNVSLDRSKSYWYDYSKVAGGNKAIISDAANWPPLDGRSLSGYQKKRVWLNDGAGAFKEVAQLVGVTDVNDGRSVALADFNNSGKLDVVVANQKGPLLLYKNSVAPEHKWIDFELEGQVSNRSAIGAQVRVFWNGGQQVQEVSGGSGFCAQNQRRLHFGLGKAAAIDRVEIRWPSGKIQTVTAPEPNKIHKIKETA